MLIDCLLIAYARIQPKWQAALRAVVQVRWPLVVVAVVEVGVVELVVRWVDLSQELLSPTTNNYDYVDYFPDP